MKFNKFISVSCIVALIVTIFPLWGSESIQASTLGVDANVEIMESTIIRKADKELLGISHGIPQSQKVLTDDPSSTAIRSEYYSLMNGFPLSLNRGGVGQQFLWKNTLGDMSERAGFPNPGFSSAPMNFGLVEWLKSVLDVNPDATIVWGFNMLQPNAAADAADLAEFLTGDGTTNPNGGTNWAQRRIDLGIANPVKVKYELGNEMDWGSIGWTVGTYIVESKKIIDAVRAVDPNAKFSAHAKTSPWTADINSGGTNDGTSTGTWKDWHREVLTQLGNDIDFITLHPYYVANALNVTRFMDTITNDILAWEAGVGNTKPLKKIKIYISEHGIWPLRIDTDTFDNSGYRTHNLEGSLATAEFITTMFHRNDISMVTLHAFTAGPWYAVNKDPSTGLYLSGVGLMMKVLKQALGIDVVKSNVTGANTDTTQNDVTFTVNAMTTASGGLNLVLINRDPLSKRDVSFQFEKDYKLVKRTTYTGSSIYSDTNTANPTTTNTVTINDETRFNHELVPDKSIVVLYLEKKNVALAKTATASSVDSIFTSNLAVDGYTNTRWSSSFTNTEWLQVDLGAIYNINEVTLNWQAAYGKSFKIEVSDTGSIGTWTPIYSTTTGSGGIQSLTGLSGSGRYIRMYGTERVLINGFFYGYSLNEFQVFGKLKNLALGKPTTASSVQTPTPTFSSNLAVDGNINTRWSSTYADPQWLQVDLGAIYNINEVILNWQAAYGKEFMIQVSDTGLTGTWTTIYNTISGTGGIQGLAGLSGSGRYIRMYGTVRGTIYGYSLNEIQVFGTLKNLALGKPTTASSVQSSPSYSANLAVDNIMGTRWASIENDSQWLQVDLGTTYNIKQVILNWQTAYGKEFLIQVSLTGDNGTWNTINNTTMGTGGIQDLNGLSGNGRYIRMYGIKRGTIYGYSLYEFQVFGSSM